MKLFLLALTLALTTAKSLPADGNFEPVELIVNGVPDGEALEIGDIVDIKLKHHVDGQIASVSDLLYPLTAQGIADAVAAEAENESDAQLPVVPEPAPLPELEPVILPQPILPGVVPEPVELPTPELPVIQPGPDTIVPPPGPVPPLEVVDELEVVEVPQIPNGEIFNDGNVQITVNTPNESGIIPTLQNWLQIFLNYFNNGVQTNQQIV